MIQVHSRDLYQVQLSFLSSYHLVLLHLLVLVLVLLLVVVLVPGATFLSSSYHLGGDLKEGD